MIHPQRERAGRARLPLTIAAGMAMCYRAPASACQTRSCVFGGFLHVDASERRAIDSPSPETFDRGTRGAGVHHPAGIAGLTAALRLPQAGLTVLGSKGRTAVACSRRRSRRSVTRSASPPAASTGRARRRRRSRTAASTALFARANAQRPRSHAARRASRRSALHRNEEEPWPKPRNR